MTVVGDSTSRAAVKENIAVPEADLNLKKIRQKHVQFVDPLCPKCTTCGSGCCKDFSVCGESALPRDGVDGAAVFGA